jgi:hypothetical protein
MRVTLDTNVWSYIGVREESRDFEELEDRLNIEVVIPPSSLIEVVRTTDPVIRQQILRAITSRGGRRVHLLSEARLEADELVAELGRARPNWKRPTPNLGRLRELDTFWTRRVYQVAQRDPDSLATNEKRIEVDEYLTEVQQETQTRARASDFDATQAEPYAYPDGDPSGDNSIGWDGGPVRLWRMQNAHMWWNQLTIVPRRRIIRGSTRIRFDTTYFDWIDPRIDTAAIARDRESWNRFWYYEADRMAMPRNWIREVVPFAQLVWKIGSGNPRDAQHATYLFDTDLFITADKRYRMTLELVRQWTSVPFADVARIDVPDQETALLVAQIENAVMNRARSGSA